MAGIMPAFVKRLKARRDLDLALAVYLLGRTPLRKLLRQKYSEQWRGFAEDIINGAKPYDEALVLIYVLIIDTFNNDLGETHAKEVVDAICAGRFENRPAVFDIIAQAAYFALLMEEDGSATKGVAALFLTDIAKWFSDDPALQEQVREYLLQSTLRFRSKAHEATKRADRKLAAGV